MNFTLFRCMVYCKFTVQKEVILSALQITIWIMDGQNVCYSDAIWKADNSTMGNIAVICMQDLKIIQILTVHLIKCTSRQPQTLCILNVLDNSHLQSLRHYALFIETPSLPLSVNKTLKMPQKFLRFIVKLSSVK